ncbi:MAG TPA: hypothetical protein VIL00_13525 [Pseudonocardiaceae bacterium]
MARRSSSASVVPLVASVTAAAALTGVAVFTVTHTGCTDPGRYVQRDGGVVELVGGCVEPNDLTVVPKPERRTVQPSPGLEPPRPGAFVQP